MDIAMFPQSKMELFLRTVEVAWFIPGRIRLYSRSLQGCAPLARETEARLSGRTGIKSVHASEVTGSILIEYDPEALRRDPELCRAEEYIRTHVKKRKG